MSKRLIVKESCHKLTHANSRGANTPQDQGYSRCASTTPTERSAAASANGQNHWYYINHTPRTPVLGRHGANSSILARGRSAKPPAMLAPRRLDAGGLL
jgi:hypothetical protein